MPWFHAYHLTISFTSPNFPRLFFGGTRMMLCTYFHWLPLFQNLPNRKELQ